MKKTLLLFTISFPYDALEQSFIQNELNFLNQSFDQVYIIPTSVKGEKYSIPSNIVVLEELSNNLKSSNLSIKTRTLFSVSLLRELFRIKFNPSKIKSAISTRLAALITKDWLTEFLKKENIDETLLYTFWHNFSTLGCIYFKQENPNIKVVSRCHNFDLYGNQENGFYVPFQTEIVNEIDGIFPVSLDGENYLKNKFPRAKCRVAIMGVPAAKKLNLESNDGAIRIVSCSYLIPRKRVDLILCGLSSLAQLIPEKEFYWTHIGNGPEMEKLKSLSKLVPNNFTIDFVGSLSNEEVHSFYISNPVDLFINASTKEGTPVSIMEAISYGIPILATAFGGNQEIVERGAGVLLKPNPTKEEMAQKIKSLIDSGELFAFRAQSKMVWENYYNSDRNYLDFSRHLENIF